MREKQKILFNKNHISVVQHDNVTHHWDDPRDQSGLNFLDYYIISKKKYTTNTTLKTLNKSDILKKEKEYNNWRPKYEYKKMESPLGFYYTKTILVNEKDRPAPVMSSDYSITEHKEMRFIDLHFNNQYYMISYPTRYNDISIESNYNFPQIETRPWEIFDNGWNEHYTYDLLKVLNDIFEKAKKYKLKEFDNSNKYWYEDQIKDWTGKNWKDIQMTTYFELFGNKEGPKAQTNDEKILAAGFDLKTSFRKEKEIDKK